MPSWKLNIFVSAVTIKFNAGEGSYTEIINLYTKLTEAEKNEILAEIQL